MPKNQKNLSTNKSVVKKSKTVKKTSDNNNKKEVTVAKKVIPSRNTKNSAIKKGSTQKSSTSSKNTIKKKTNKVSSKNNISKKPLKKTSTATKTSKAINKVAKVKKHKKVEVIEYYDLPYRYNQTVVKILAQTPNILFVYWDISDIDRKKYIKEFGDNFFETTFPVLIIYNKTMDYSFEIEINDYANSWYFNVDDAKCDYEIELGRRAKSLSVQFPNNYMYIVSSNVIEAPNNHILFEKNTQMLFFRDIKSNTRFLKDISQFEFIKYIGKIYNIYDVYKKMYTDEELHDLEKNPSSSF